MLKWTSNLVVKHNIMTLILFKFCSIHISHREYQILKSLWAQGLKTTSELLKPKKTFWAGNLVAREVQCSLAR